MEQGYDPIRFIFQVKRDLLCCICHRVLKEPRLCEAEEHCFCLSCITQHLDKEAKTCPECREPLALETLKLSQMFLKKVLSELRIRCDYNDRGCPEQVKLRNLEDHVIDCKYRPTLDAEKYNTQVSQKDQQNFCQMKAEFSSDGAEQNELSQKRIEIKVEKKDETRGEVAELKRKYDDNYEKVKKMKTNVSQAELNIHYLEIARKQDQMEVRQDEMKKARDEVKQTQSGINEKVLEIEVHHIEMARKQDQMEVRQDETKKALDEMKQTQSGINEKVDKMEGDFQMMKRQFERFQGLLGHQLQENIVNQDVIIIGGSCTSRNRPPLNTVEKYNLVEKRSMLPRLNHPRTGSASCVYKNDILVVGGFDGAEGEATIEVLKMNQHPLRWTMFDGKLPVKLSDHDVIVYQGKLYVIGGHDVDEKKSSNAIYEIGLTPPYTAKQLTRLPEPRDDLRAELVNGKIFILGGRTTYHSTDTLDSVVVYDLIKNEFKPCPSLPQPVCEMSTVIWGDNIIVLGGKDKTDRALSDVIMYDTETGKSQPLPSMIYRRYGCSAVITNDVIVVFGGWNKEQGYLNSVETFTIGGDGWKELPGMKQKRCNATAVVKPHI
ncbi:uncharacterized protein LOC114538478 [Dendronephthya gigantea]|uniref:uncharacterized protein LOC114538478 n=1 Tax=Dendronephthya gigantea TaxID=151771 RepID=UPI00106A726D|nr:uncharacterized protein LOC114538478 [Dendronephthya gigantea]